MTTVSYAQNYEDVMLLRALRNIEHGFYVDVGAQDPIADSVTRLFYERGWRGINIDPVEYWYRRLCEDRPEDVNLNVAVGNDPGPLKLFEVLDSGLSTVDESFARRHEQAGFALRERLVPCRRLDSILDEYRPGTIHFLKIDCEGAERSVLESVDLGRWRPWVILLEATEPSSQVPTYDQWEGLLTSSGYVFAYADGLNRFYVANEKQDLLAAFLVPPNVFDGFVTRRESDAVRRVEQLGSELVQAAQRERDLEARVSVLHEQLDFAEGQLTRLAAELQEATASAAALRQIHERVSHDLVVALDEIRRLKDMDRRRALAETELAMIKKSASWRLTAPLRWVRFQIGLLRSQGLASRLRSLFKKLARALLGRMFRWLETRPRLRRAGAALARRLGLEARLRSLYRHWWLPSMHAAGAPVAAGVTANADLSAPRSAIEGQTPAQGAPILSPRARQIKTWLDAARRSHLGGP